MRNFVAHYLMVSSQALQNTEQDLWLPAWKKSRFSTRRTVTFIYALLQPYRLPLPFVCGEVFHGKKINRPTGESAISLAGKFASIEYEEEISSHR